VKLLKLTVYLMIATMFVACTTKEKLDFDLELTAHYPLDSLPSASGIFYQGSSIFIVGDDSPLLFILDDTGQVTNEKKLSAIDSMVNGRTPKRIKADYECMEIIEYEGTDFLLVLSSGSTQKTRDTAVLIELQTREIIAKKNLRPLYEKIKETSGISQNDEINIEGLAVSGSHAYLLHRGNISGNLVVSLTKESLLKYLLSQDDHIPELNAYQFLLPDYQGSKAGFSGACMMPDNNGILFTASLEDTDNVYDDGQIRGSYIGIIPISGLLNGKYSAKLVHSEGKVLTKKLEGLTIKSADKNKLVILSVSDNDDGTSDLFELSIILK